MERVCHVLFATATNPVISDQWWSVIREVEGSSFHLQSFLLTDSSLVASVYIRAVALSRTVSTVQVVTRNIQSGHWVFNNSERGAEKLSAILNSVYFVPLSGGNLKSLKSVEMKQRGNNH